MPEYDLNDVTPAPTPAPKKTFQLRVNGSEPVRAAWTAGQTFQQALSAIFPLALRNRTNAFNATIEVLINVRED